MLTKTRRRNTSAKKRAPTGPRYPRDPATRYAVRVVEGKIVTGRLVRLACERHLRDLVDAGDRGLFWDPAEVARKVEFFHDVCRLNGGDFEGVPFDLEPWQAFIVGSLFAWKRATDETRRFRSAYLEIGKGNGKSPLAAGVGILMLTGDDEARAEVYAAAAKRDQAMILFRDAVAMVDQSPALSSRLTKSGQNPVWNLAYLRNGSFFRPIASDDAQSGPRPHCALLDEIHEHTDPNVVNMMRAGTKGRRQPLIFEITNSGWDRHSICWQHHDYSQRVLEGHAIDDEWFAYVCGLDPEVKDADGKVIRPADDWRDESVWVKANPNLGVSITVDYLRKQVREAEGMPAQQGIVRRLNFCEWTEQATPWLELAVWDKNAGQPDFAALLGRDCFGGLDLSSTTDLSAWLKVFPQPDGFFDVVAQFWIPEENLRQRVKRDRVPYDQWLREGWIEATSGNVIDYDVIRARVRQDAGVYQIREIGFDPYNATQLSTQLADDGCPMVQVRQGFLSLGPPMKELEKVLLQGKIRHGGNPVLRWMLQNVAVVTDPADNKKPAKDKSRDRIDGIVALINAMSRVIVAPAPAQPDVWVL